MTVPSNLPPGVTQRMLDDQIGPDDVTQVVSFAGERCTRCGASFSSGTAWETPEGRLYCTACATHYDDEGDPE